MKTAEQLHRTIRFAREDYDFFRERAYVARVMGESAMEWAWERAARDASDAEQEALAALARLEH
jgi:hypothetical protein